MRWKSFTQWGGKGRRGTSARSRAGKLYCTCVELCRVDGTVRKTSKTRWRVSHASEMCFNGNTRWSSVWPQSTPPLPPWYFSALHLTQRQILSLLENEPKKKNLHSLCREILEYNSIKMRRQKMSSLSGPAQHYFKAVCQNWIRSACNSWHFRNTGALSPCKIMCCLM